jgi:hypothetical protein
MALALRREKVAALYLQGVSQYQIGVQLGVLQQTVSRDLQVLEQRWLESALSSTDRLKAEQLAKINHMEAEAWAAWERSKQERETRTARNASRTGRAKGDKQDPGDQLTETGLRKEQRCGDTEYLKTVQ